MIRYEAMVSLIFCILRTGFICDPMSPLCLLGISACCAKFLQDCGNRPHGGTHLSDAQPVVPSAAPMELWLLQFSAEVE